jgi:hypothetical protein
MMVRHLMLTQLRKILTQFKKTKNCILDGVPSWNLTSSLKWNVYVFPSSDTSHFLASKGLIPSLYTTVKDIGDMNPHVYGGSMSAESMIYEPLVRNTSLIPSFVLRTSGSYIILSADIDPP